MVWLQIKLELSLLRLAKKIDKPQLQFDYHIHPNYHAVCLGFLKLLEKTHSEISSYNMCIL